MVKVITIRDDVYKALLKLKKKDGLSFSQIIEKLIEEHDKRKGNKFNMLLLAGSLKASKVKMRKIKKMRKGL